MRLLTELAGIRTIGSGNMFNFKFQLLKHFAEYLIGIIYDIQKNLHSICDEHSLACWFFGCLHNLRCCLVHVHAFFYLLVNSKCCSSVNCKIEVCSVQQDSQSTHHVLYFNIPVCCQKFNFFQKLKCMLKFCFFISI